MMSDAHAGAVAGFAVRSDVPLAYLRTGGTEPLSVALGPAEPEPEPADPGVVAAPGEPVPREALEDARP